MNVHFIAIGGAAMHNLALALHHKGYIITGSDDEIFEPSRSRLKNNGLLPEKDGWFPEKIHPGLDAVILGMHARKDNPELLKAQELGLKIYSYPHFIYEQTKNKTRAVIGGSHGKTTITSMIMHVLKYSGKKFDYLVGSQIAGFDTMVGLSEDSTCAVIEGDEYLASPVTPVPKFHLYHPHIALISGIAWDHINVFPTYADYVKQFEIFIETIETNGKLVYCSNDHDLAELVKNTTRRDLDLYGYRIPEHRIENGVTTLKTPEGDVPLEIFGDHNLMNLEGARLVCQALGIGTGEFCEAIKTFTGAARRLELIRKTENAVIYKDFAHSPSKLKATIHAVKQQYPHRKLTAVMELHTFSSLNKNFLAEYAGCMDEADIAAVFYSPETVAHKKLESISKEDIAADFGNKNLLVFDNPDELHNWMKNLNTENENILLMSSGNWGGINITDLFRLQA